MTAQLIREITAEARASNQSIVHDPDAPPDDAGEGDAEPAPKPPAKPDGKAQPKKEPDGNEDAEVEESAEDGEDPSEDGESPEAQGALDAEAVKRLIAEAGEDGVDMLALAQALGVDPEKLKVTPAQHRILRLQQSKAKRMIQQAHDLSKRLNEQYGDQVKARKAAADGDLNPAIEFIEGTFGMGWNELNRMVGQLLQGKPVKDLESKRELIELRKKEAARAEAEKKALEESAAQKKVADAKTWIANSLKGDKLATAELNKQLSDAGFPTITDLVFEEMKAGYARGLTDPRKALELVKQKLTKQARALSAVVGTGKPAPTPKPKPLSSSKPRADGQTGSAGNGRPMTDKELREAVLKEAGLWR